MELKPLIIAPTLSSGLPRTTAANKIAALPLRVWVYAFGRDFLKPSNSVGLLDMEFC